MTEELKELQSEFALIDLIKASYNSSPIEILIKKLDVIQIRMEQDKNHKLPHVHIKYGVENHIASYNISDGERIVGDLDKQYEKVTKKWILKNKEALLKIWEELQKGDNQAYELSISKL